MGIIFIMFAELWVIFFQTCAELWVQIFNQNGTSSFNMRLSNLPPPPRDKYTERGTIVAYDVYYIDVISVFVSGTDVMYMCTEGSISGIMER